jgi:hypothetical protein
VFKHWNEFVNETPYCTGLIDYSLIFTALARQTAICELLCLSGYVSGKFEGGWDKLGERMLALGATEKKYDDKTLRRKGEALFVWDRACVDVKQIGHNEFRLIWGANDDKIHQDLCELGRSLVPADPEGSVYVLVPTQQGLQLKSIGIGAVPVEKDNYRPEAMREFDKVVKDLQEPNPLGRLAIFDGPPGTGKTYLVRALLSALPKIKFLILPSNMVETLSGPQLLSTLIGESDVKYGAPTEATDVPSKKKTMVLVIEDADRCLSKRAGNDMAPLSSLLNMSDGIIGNLLDLRIICTTNAEIDDIDEAILRTGRLSARVEVGLLDPEQAKTIYARVGGTKPQTWDRKFYALSDVYAMAKGLDSEETESCTPKRKIGF